MYLAKLKETESELGVMKERCTRQEGELVKKSCKYQNSLPDILYFVL